MADEEKRLNLSDGKVEMVNVETLRHNRERGLVLQYLLLAGPNGATFSELRRYLKLMGRAVTRDGLEFHLKTYLQPKGFISITEAAPDPEGPPAIHLIHITPKGVDRVDQRPDGDDGITF